MAPGYQMMDQLQLYLREKRFGQESTGGVAVLVMSGGVMALCWKSMLGDCEFTI